MRLIISCEHAANSVPAPYAHLFWGRRDVLATNRAYDIGAAGLARYLGRHLAASVFLGGITRLLVDLNRSPGNKRFLFTEFSKGLTAGDQEQLLRRYYSPFRHRVEEAVKIAVDAGRPVLHLSLHSFVPVLRGRPRNADIGLLYDPARPDERRIGLKLKAALGRRLPDLRIRCNYPYQGKSDGFATYLRKGYPAGYYCGIEIELNQALLPATGRRWRQVRENLVGALRQVGTMAAPSGLPGVKCED
jgi:predicted N-formylglutamate amidohydrolase